MCEYSVQSWMFNRSEPEKLFIEKIYNTKQPVVYTYNHVKHQVLNTNYKRYRKNNSLLRKVMDLSLLSEHEINDYVERILAIKFRCK